MNKNDISRNKTPEDLDRRFNFGKIIEENNQHNTKIEDIKQDVNQIQNDIDTISNTLENDVVLKEEGKGLSTNDFSDEYQQDVDDNTEARHSHNNKTVLDSINQSEYTDLKNKKHSHQNKSILDSIDGTVEYNLNTYKTNAVTNVTGKCIKKNNRVVINLFAEISAEASAETTLFNLPVALSTLVQFLFWDGSDVNIGTVSTTGAVKAVFNNTTNNIIINLCFDTRKEES